MSAGLYAHLKVADEPVGEITIPAGSKGMTFDFALSEPRLSRVVMEKNIISLSRSALQTRDVSAGSVDWQKN